MPKFIATALLLFFLASDAMGAASLLEYENRVFRASEQVQRIITDSDYEDEGVSYIKTLLPRTEQVVINDQTVEVDNTWLHILLNSYEAESDSNKRREKLDEVEARLQALDEHLRSALEPSSGDAEDADSRQKIQNILSRQEYREKTDSPLAAMIKNLRRKVLDLIRDLFLRVVRALFGQGAQASWFFRGIIIAGLVVALIIIARMARRLRRGKKPDKKTRTVLGEEIEEGVKPGDLADSALAAARTGDFRVAVRKLYISLLYELAERNLIEIEPHATNREYLAKVSRFATLAQPMRYLTDRFDYFWYGMFPSTEEDFSTYLASYKEAMDHARKLGDQRATAG